MFINAKGKKMKRNLLAAGAAALALASGVQAAEFSARLSGSGQEFFPDPADSIGMPGGCNPSVDPNSTACVYGWVDVTSWAGEVVVSTASSVDGTYSYGAGLEAIRFESDYGDFTYSAGDPYVQEFNGLQYYWDGLAPGALVTISGGRIVGLSAEYDTDPENYTFGGLGVSVRGGMNDGGHGVGMWLSGVLTAVPEAPTSALLALGLGALALSRRRA